MDSNERNELETKIAVWARVAVEKLGLNRGIVSTLAARFVIREICCHCPKKERECNTSAEFEQLARRFDDGGKEGEVGGDIIDLYALIYGWDKPWPEDIPEALKKIIAKRKEKATFQTE